MRGPRGCAPAGTPKAPASAHQVQQREQEDPQQVDEVPEARATLDGRHPGGADVVAARLRQQEPQHADADADVEEMQSGQDEVVEEEVVRTGAVAAGCQRHILIDLEADEEQAERDRRRNSFGGNRLRACADRAERHDDAQRAGEQDQGVRDADADVQRRAGDVEQLGRLGPLHHEGDEEDAEHEHVAEQEHPCAGLGGDPPGGWIARRRRSRRHGVAASRLSAASSALMDFSSTTVVPIIQTIRARPGR